jgi:hypothetical protein
MSAAEQHADPQRGRPLNTGSGAAVIDFTRRRHGGARVTAQGRRNMGTPSGPDQGRPEDRSLQLWAEDIEKSFNEIGQTLTDDDTASVFVRTLQVWERALEGSHATGLITDGQLAELLAVIRGMVQAPRLV